MPVTTLQPTGVRNVVERHRSVASRGSLRGARVGLVSNGLGETTRLLGIVHGLLSERTGTGEAFLIEKPHRSVPPTPEDWTRLTTQADVVIAGFGGCGSCSTRTIRDAMELEWAGIRSVALIHEDMLPGVRAMTRLSGMADYRYVVIDKTRTSLCDWDEATLETVARSVVDQVGDCLSSAGQRKDSSSVSQPDAAGVVEEMRRLVAADGADLRLLGIAADGTLEIRLVLDEISCAECVLPHELLVQMIEDHVQRSLPTAAGIRLFDDRFDRQGANFANSD